MLNVYALQGKKTDSEVKIFQKKSNAGSFYDVIDDENDP